MCQVPNWSSCRPCCRQTSTVLLSVRDCDKSFASPSNSKGFHHLGVLSDFRSDREEAEIIL